MNSLIVISLTELLKIGQILIRDNNSHYVLDFTSTSVWVQIITKHMLDKLGLETGDPVQSSTFTTYLAL